MEGRSFRDVRIPLCPFSPIELPRMSSVRQIFPSARVESVSRSLREAFLARAPFSRIGPGMSIAVACGSRGIANLAECVAALIAELKRLGTHPFVFPAMGSHAGASAEGQAALLARHGIDEAAIGCPVRSCMETVLIGRTETGVDVFMDRLAAAADAIIPVARVKPHTNFRGRVESGLAKMLAVGMGKETGASRLHERGFDEFPSLLPAVAEIVLGSRNIPFGVALVENAAYDTAHLEIVPGESILEREPRLLDMARSLMARLHFGEIDVLVIDRIGKEISGAGMDTNVTGRNVRGISWDGITTVSKIVVLGLDPRSEGNATGIGQADIITARLLGEIDLDSTYRNTITAKYLDGAAIPLVAATDRDAISIAAATLVRRTPAQARIVRILDTATLGSIQVSEALVPYVRERTDLFGIPSHPRWMCFDADGALAPMEENGTAASVDSGSG